MDFIQQATLIAAEHFAGGTHEPLAVVEAGGQLFQAKPNFDAANRAVVWCAERVAIMTAQRAGNLKINRLALAFPICTCQPINFRPFPCAICRLAMLDAAADDFVLTILGVRSVSIQELRALRRS